MKEFYRICILKEGYKRSQGKGKVTLSTFVVSYLCDHQLFRGWLHGDRLPGLVGHRFHCVVVIGVMVVIVMVNRVPVVLLLKEINSIMSTPRRKLQIIPLIPLHEFQL